MKKPIIAIPLGDPAGIGPEITMHTWASDEVQEISKLILVGDEFVVKKSIRRNRIRFKD